MKPTIATVTLELDDGTKVTYTGVVDHDNWEVTLDWPTRKVPAGPPDSFMYKWEHVPGAQRADIKLRLTNVDVTTSTEVKSA